MIRTLAAIAGAMCVLVAPAQAQGAAEETPAIPIDRRPPAYPAECLVKAEKDAPSQYVILVFDISRNGDVENVRVRESSDPCFEPVAVAAARSWKYEPRRISGSRADQTDMEVTLNFVIDQETQAEDFDARPIVRVPPQYPEHCMRNAKDEESVMVMFDVTETGDTENIRVIDSTHKCLNQAATASVARWKYTPKVVGGQPVARRGVEVLLTFVLEDPSLKDYRVRGAVKVKLLRAQRLGRDPKTIAEANAILEEVYGEYGETFSMMELSAYHQIRAIVKINQKEYAAALDSLRIVQRLAVVPADTMKAIEETIYQLEQALGVGPTVPQNDDPKTPPQAGEQ